MNLFVEHVTLSSHNNHVPNPIPNYEKKKPHPLTLNLIIAGANMQEDSRRHWFYHLKPFFSCHNKFRILVCNEKISVQIWCDLFRNFRSVLQEN